MVVGTLVAGGVSGASDPALTSLPARRAPLPPPSRRSASVGRKGLTFLVQGAKIEALMDGIEVGEPRNGRACDASFLSERTRDVPSVRTG